MLRHLIIRISLYYLSSGLLQEVKNNEKNQTFSPKSGCGRLGEVALTRGSKYSNLTWKLLVFWKTGR